MTAARRRLPLVPTLMTLVIAVTCLALGVWQLQRREWKHDLIARAGTAVSQPLLEPRDYYRAMIGEASVQYRRAELPCSPGTVLPYDLRGGANRAGQSGFLVLVSCRPNRKPPDIVAVAGWTARPDAAALPVTVDTVFRGIIIERPYGRAKARPLFMLIPDTAVPPLQPAAQPTPDDLPDNHLSYALQWFAFAVTVVVIYGLWLRRRPS
ncbi:hypothetical protein IP88_09280 [alpha proteobacterium AAP81b]|nr:hypothetical protein IP88_09280 [alpha proteobacterium AAP81b]